MKLIGAILLAAASGLFGAALTASGKKKTRLLSAMITSLGMLRAEIATRLTPLPECAERLAESGPGACRSFYASLASAMDALGDVEFSQLWAACVSTLELPRGAREPLLDLGRSLGRFNAPEQAAAIDRCCEQLGGIYSDIRAAEPAAVKLKLGLSLACGLMLAVLLY